MIASVSRRIGRRGPCVLFQPFTSRMYSTSFVPEHEEVKESDIVRLEEFLINKPNILVVTGAGISTESGIPDYRSKGVGLYARTNSRPVQFPDFVKSEAIRRRYWARNFVAWPRFSAFEPNAIHHTLARFEREGRMIGLVTQNVDTLHTKAGHKNVLEIHGNGYKVICLGCKFQIGRHEFQQILTSLNPTPVDSSQVLRPDGDIELADEYVEQFRVPPCPECGGNLKPDIVFFGDNVPQTKIKEIVRLNCLSDGLLVLGSSLSVFSSFRIVLQTKELGLPVALVTIGDTRGDPKADLKISAKCGSIIPKLFQKR